MNVHIQVFVWTYAFFSLRQIPKSGMALSYGRLCLSILNHKIVFQVVMSFYIYHQQCMRVPVTPHLCQQLIWSVFLILVILISVLWYYLIVLLICIFLMTNVLSTFLCANLPFLCERSDLLFIDYIFLFSYCWVLRVLYIFYIQILY